MDDKKLSYLQDHLGTDKMPQLTKSTFSSWDDVYRWVFYHASLLWASDQMSKRETRDFMCKLLFHVFVNKECNLGTWPEVYNYVFKIYLHLRRTTTISSIASEKLMINVMHHLQDNTSYRRPNWA